MALSLPPGVRFLVLQQVVRLLVVVLGFAALRMGGELDGLRAPIASLAVLASCWRGRPRMASHHWLVLQVAFLLWLIVGAALLHRPLITLFAELLVFVQVHRLLTRSRGKDDLYLCFIAFGQVLITSVLTIELLYLLLFGGFVVVVSWNLLLCRLTSAVEQRHSRYAPGRNLPSSVYGDLDGVTRPRALLIGAALALVLLGSTGVLFFTLPRMQASFLDAGFVSPLHVSGFAERVHLGDVGSLKLSAEPVMRVKLHNQQGEQLVSGGLYWHGLALDRFDGRNWELSDRGRIELHSLAASGARGPPRQHSWNLRQEVTLEPLDSDVLFYVSDVVGIYGDFRRLEAVTTEGYYLPGLRAESGGRLSYTVYSHPRQHTVEVLRSQRPDEVDRDLLARYTQLPSQISPRIAEIAAQWTEGAATAVDAALVVQDRLRREYSYSLDQEASAYADPVLAFLDEVKEGHCEYYATAMALLLRTRGVPTRLVNGFYGGEWNAPGEYWLIRQRDAHSWVEVYFPESGWVTFDPTPSVGLGFTGRARIQLLARLGAWADYAELMWEDVLLDYGLDSQVEAVRSLLAALRGWGGPADPSGGLWTRVVSHFVAPPEAADEHPSGLLGWLVLVGVLALAAALFAAVRAGALPTFIAGGSERRICRLVAQLEASWQRAAPPAPVPRGARTPLAWARWAAEQDSERFSEAPEAIERYYDVRFGEAEVSRDLEAVLRRLARRSRGWRPVSYSKERDQNNSVS